MKSILSTRILNTTVEKLFNAYSKPEILIKWWGPHGFTNRFNEFNFSENGLWDFYMIESNGKEYHNQIVFKQIIANKKIVATHVNAPVFEFEVDFIKISNLQTELQFKMSFEDENIYKALVSFVPEKNQENFDRLESVL